jgi:hypothetical protein
MKLLHTNERENKKIIHKKGAIKITLSRLSSFSVILRNVHGNFGAHFRAKKVFLNYVPLPFISSYSSSLSFARSPHRLLKVKKNRFDLMFRGWWWWWW